NEIIIEINKESAPSGKAEGRKKIPTRKKIFPKSRKLLKLYLKLEIFINFINF
mgnify:CR=1